MTNYYIEEYGSVHLGDVNIGKSNIHAFFVTRNRNSSLLQDHPEFFPAIEFDTDPVGVQKCLSILNTYENIQFVIDIRNTYIIIHSDVETLSNIIQEIDTSNNLMSVNEAIEEIIMEELQS